MHRDAYEAVELFAGRFGQKTLGPRLVVARRVAVEKPPEERHERDALEVAAFLRGERVFLVAHHRLEPVRVEERLRRERRDDLAESDVRLGERLRVAIGSEKNRADR